MPGAVSTILAVPRPKWKSSVPWNSPVATVRGANGVGCGSTEADGAAAADGEGARPTDDGAAVDTTSAAGSGSISSVRTQIGDARYQVSGNPTARTTARRTPDRPGCRRAAANQPARHAISEDHDRDDHRPDRDRDAVRVQTVEERALQVGQGLHRRMMPPTP